jgi:dienelactone hydrolase
MFSRIVALLLFATVVQAADTTSRRADLDELLRVLPKSAPWEQWLQQSGELPPDFSALPFRPFLPDPLTFENNAPVRNRGDWSKRREELLKLFQHYIIGLVPPAPGNVRVASRVETVEAAATREELVLEFGPDHRAKLRCEVITPKGKGPFPVFITQDNHRRWALVAVSRGYIACVYAGADSADDTAAWIPIWPQHDWTKLTRRAWAASRCIDHLVTRPDVDRARIAFTGHSRNGKTSIIGAALDERISAVISSSSGAGGACAFRQFSEREAGEGIEFISRSFPDWVHPRLRFFAGREDRLPVDMPELMACVAPRKFLFSTALNDNVESVWAIEQSLANARRAYELLGARDGIGLLYREGSHGTDAHDIERYVDWLDVQFGRATGAVTSEPMFPTLDQWAKAAGEKIDVPSFKAASSETPRIVKAEALKAARWALGDEPPAAASVHGNYGAEAQHNAAMLGRSPVPAGLAKLSLNFGNYIAGDVYFQTNADKRAEKLPAVVWLHPICVSGGYTPAYKRGESPHLAVARAGFVVFSFDQIGNGTRIEEARRFYERYPRWSLRGKTVADTRAALDALEKLPFVDAKRLWLLGYAEGAATALHVAALDPRVAGVAAAGGFDPMRPSAANFGEPLAARFQRTYPMQPRLAAFAGSEDRIPYDFRELVDVIAPRPVLLFAAKISSKVDATALARQFAVTKTAQFEVLDDYDRFGPEVQKTVIERLKKAAGL